MAAKHRPRIQPVDRVRVREPFLTDYGDFAAYADGFDGSEENYDYSGDFVSVSEGYAVIHTDADWSLCLTGEIYSRRPPVETKGWSKVVEIGFAASGKSIDFADPMYGDSPGISLPVRAPGHYRIRIHYNVIRLKGDDWGAQQLHFMVFPGKSDKVDVLK